MDVNPVDELIRVVASHFAGPDAPLNDKALRIRRGGKFHLREQLGINGLPAAWRVQVALRWKLGLPPAE